MTLHAEIVEILRDQPSSEATTVELAGMVNERDRYHKANGSPVTPYQIHGRTKNYPQIFEREGQIVRLREAT